VTGNQTLHLAKHKFRRIASAGAGPAFANGAIAANAIAKFEV
jgi:hypothetical protein